MEALDPAALEAAKARLLEVVNLLVKSLVDEEGRVEISAYPAHTLVLFEVRCAPEDFGKLIGRSGANARALRLFIRAMGRKNRLDAYVKVIDPQGQEYVFPDRDKAAGEAPPALKTGVKPPP